MNYDCLIVDDETVLADSTAEYFQLFGVKTKAVYDAASCRTFFKENTADLILLDINLHNESGFSLCKELREQTQIPILFISARSGNDDKLVALNIGGDDYIEKPYSLSVLLAKVKVVLKRYAKKEMMIYQDDRLTIDVRAKQVMVEGISMKFTSLEFKLLVYLVQHANQVVSKQELFTHVWEDKLTQDGTLNVHIRKIRESIEIDPGQPSYIVTVWGEGYMFCGASK
ncbi:MAG: response regulator transcription factor [Erysipelotrichaceae bacterium]|nr:response regulator transcription factor [Erysipelotrichaceae bacterium]MCI9524905.1 response regulator transcription factor [Erysipelotrichaceae bacterium]